VSVGSEITICDYHYHSMTHHTPVPRQMSMIDGASAVPSSSQPKSAAAAKGRSRSEMEKEILDTEIEFHQRRQSGEEVTELQAKLDSLKAQVGDLHCLTAYQQRGRGQYRSVLDVRFPAQLERCNTIPRCQGQHSTASVTDSM